MKKLIAIPIVLTTLWANANPEEINQQLKEQYYDEITNAPISMERHKEIMANTDNKVLGLEDSIKDLNSELEKLLSATKKITKTNARLVSSINNYEETKTSLTKEIEIKTLKILELSESIELMEARKDHYDINIKVLEDKLVSASQYKSQYDETLQVLNKSRWHSVELENKIELMTYQIDQAKNSIKEAINSEVPTVEEASEVVKEELITNKELNTKEIK